MQCLVRRPIRVDGRQQFTPFLGPGLPLRCMQPFVCQTFSVDSRAYGPNVGP